MRCTLVQGLVRADLLLQEATGKVSPMRPGVRRLIELARGDIMAALVLLEAVGGGDQAEAVEQGAVRYGPVP